MYTPGHYLNSPTYLCVEHCNREGLELATKPKTKEIKPKKKKTNWYKVPVDLYEAIKLLDKELDEETKQEFRDYKVSPTKIKITYVSKNGSDAESLEFKDHFHCYIIGGRGMRNSWGLWQDSPLAHWFRKRGIFHADDMSGVISTAFYHHIVGDKEINDEWVESERKYYEDHWIKSGCQIPTYESWLEELKKEE
jgi:hypothetical protein